MVALARGNTLDEEFFRAQQRELHGEPLGSCHGVLAKATLRGTVPRQRLGLTWSTKSLLAKKDGQQSPVPTWAS